MIKYLIITLLSTTSVLAQYAGCDYLQNLKPGETHDIFSPRYGNIPPQRYIAGTNCRWRALAPLLHQIKLNCFDMRLPENKCKDRVEVSWKGIYNDPTPSYACAGQTFTYTTGNQLVVALRSDAAGLVGGMFRCQVVALPIIGVQIDTSILPPIGANIGRK